MDGRRRCLRIEVEKELLCGKVLNRIQGLGLFFLCQAPRKLHLSLLLLLFLQSASSKWKRFL